MLCFVCACLPTAGPALECLRTTAAVLASGPAAAGPARLLPRQDAPRLHGAVPGQAAGGLQGMRRGLREAVPVARNTASSSARTFALSRTFELALRSATR